MSDRAHTRQIQKCFCGRELRSREELETGECRRCLEEDQEFDLQEDSRLLDLQDDDPTSCFELDGEDPRDYNGPDEDDFYGDN